VCEDRLLFSLRPRVVCDENLQHTCDHLFHRRWLELGCSSVIREKLKIRDLGINRDGCPDVWITSRHG
jgi:hypothetical protein